MGMKIPRNVADDCLRLAGIDPLEGASESEFQAQLVREAKRLGWECYHTHDSRRSEAGFPDLVLIRGPVLIVAELKVKRNKPTAAQVKWLELFAGAGARAFHWRPENWAEIVEQLRAA
ncbi:vrr-nuc domain-containing protein : VRR-NUC domain protein OS=Micrococcus luteus SK58 GN=HMPREF0569_1589 PE=4 SV=1: VRR_NUC [Gemmata massiliana]|uniref:VRR-NUC domain-containing protein n=2 Tax=Gemmata massiliana TaxID=1210884 RepID=A0A6P2D6E0_9BACT|nr:vrr-nuc domain-containing protein : VRR-NUC domain protein OS=Micrococcus luteus SK58 GN=HMPREF0569_1589 PE=4 SV=1: VRR_NUC [Gemmata massiliana]